MPGIDSYTKLILHCDGADAGTTFTDSSTAQVAKTVTAVNNAQLDTAQSKFGTASGLFDGTTDYLTTADSADWDFGTADFTIDFWVRFAATEAACFYSNMASNVGLEVDFSGGAGNLEVYINGTGASVKAESWAPSVNTWYHVAIVRNGTNLMLFVDGTQLGSPTTNSTNITGSTSALIIGYFLDLTTYDLNGWIDEYRVSKGIARWTANFTPNTAPYDSNIINGNMLNVFE